LQKPSSYKIFFVGELTATIEFGSNISRVDNDRVISLFSQLSQTPLPAMTDAIPAYSSLSVCFDHGRVLSALAPGESVETWIEGQLHRLASGTADPRPVRGNNLSIPVCYDPEFGRDLAVIAAQKKLTIEEIIRIHTNRTYRVYMLGFLPGFPYMGEVDEAIAIPRKQTPENVNAGSVAIAGAQTGIYPLNSPGGWQIIGRTPSKIFDKDRQHPFMIQTGDEITFHSITRHEFESY
jgi:inhibitor of KinA